MVDFFLGVETSHFSNHFPYLVIFTFIIRKVILPTKTLVQSLYRSTHELKPRGPPADFELHCAPAFLRQPPGTRRHAHPALSHAPGVRKRTSVKMENNQRLLPTQSKALWLAEQRAKETLDLNEVTR